MDGRSFERFHIDVGVGDPLVEAVEYLETPNLLSFAEIESVVVPCYPISQQLAEKVHAYTRPHASGVSTRIKDFVDMILLAELGEISGTKLTDAIEATFQKVGDQDIPHLIPPPPRSWDRGFRRLADQIGLVENSLEASFLKIQKLIDPILTGEARNLHWRPERWSWD